MVDSVNCIRLTEFDRINFVHWVGHNGPLSHFVRFSRSDAVDQFRRLNNFEAFKIFYKMYTLFEAKNITTVYLIICDINTMNNIITELLI